MTRDPETTGKKSFSPLDMAKMGRIVIPRADTSPATSTATAPTEIKPEEPKAEAKAGDIVTIDGKGYVYATLTRKIRDRRTGERVEVPHTYRSYYSHTDPTTGVNGPGWDQRMHLTDTAYAMQRHGRTFTRQQVFSPAGKRLNDPEDAEPGTDPDMIVATDLGYFDVTNAMPDTPMLILKPMDPHNPPNQ